MIYSLLKGRLGNNLFQIAAGASLAKANGVRFVAVAPDVHLKIGVSSSNSELELLRKTILRNVEVVYDFPKNAAHYEEKQFSYQPIPYSQSTLISGYFQSERYFDEPLVRSLFSIDEETKRYIDSKYGHLLSKNITSIHIRRGDYIKNADYHPICSLNYFRRAMETIGKDSSFLIVTNDLEWCKRKFRGENIYFSDQESAVVDLYLQSMCTNNIISNSSFSWWGAWLNQNPNKVVIAPTPWFGISAQHLDVSDLIPKSWIQLENRMPFVWRLFARLRKAKRDFYLWRKQL
jgi:hypothetical protein